MVTGGKRRSGRTGTARTEVYSFTTKQWARKANMNQRRMMHSCSAVWLDPSADPTKNGIIGITVDNSSVLSVVVAGGQLL